MNFGEKLKELRTKNNLTQSDLAEKMEISSKTIGRWEKEDNIPDETKLKKLCKILKCNMEELTGEPKKVEVKAKKKDVKENKPEPKKIEKEVKEVLPVKKETKKEVVKKEEVKKNEPVIVPVVETIDKVIEEKPKKEKTFTKHDRRVLYGLSKATNIISHITQVVLVIAMCLIGIVMVCLPALFNRVEISDNMIRFEVGRDMLVIKENEEGLTVTYNEEKVFDGKISQNIYNKPVLNVLKTTSKSNIIWHLEVLLFIGLLSLIVLYVFFRSLAKITRNICNDKIFDLNNVSSLRKMSYLLISLIILSVFAEFVVNHFTNFSVKWNINLEQVMLILSLFILARVFKYGHYLKGENNE